MPTWRPPVTRGPPVRMLRDRFVREGELRRQAVTRGDFNCLSSVILSILKGDGFDLEDALCHNGCGGGPGIPELPDYQRRGRPGREEAEGQEGRKNERGGGQTHIAARGCRKEGLRCQRLCVVSRDFRKGRQLRPGPDHHRRRSNPFHPVALRPGRQSQGTQYGHHDAALRGDHTGQRPDGAGDLSRKPKGCRANRDDVNAREKGQRARPGRSSEDREAWRHDRPGGAERRSPRRQPSPRRGERLRRVTGRADGAEGRSAAGISERHRLRMPAYSESRA